MINLFLRSVILYGLIFAAIRLTGKRQISDLQPFDLVMTLLLAEVATEPIADSSIPLLYGIVPIITLFLLQYLLTLISLKSERMRNVLCGQPLVIIEKGRILEDVMRRADYTIQDLLEELRGKDVFDVTAVEYAILETNGQISILLRDGEQTPTRSDLNLPQKPAAWAKNLISDGIVNKKMLTDIGHSEQWLRLQLEKGGIEREKDVFFASIDGSGKLYVQQKRSCGGQVCSIRAEGKKNG